MKLRCCLILVVLVVLLGLGALGSAVAAKEVEDVELRTFALFGFYSMMKALTTGETHETDAFIKFATSEEHLKMGIIIQSAMDYAKDYVEYRQKLPEERAKAREEACAKVAETNAQIKSSLDSLINDEKAPFRRQAYDMSHALAYWELALLDACASITTSYRMWERWFFEREFYGKPEWLLGPLYNEYKQRLLDPANDCAKRSSDKRWEQIASLLRQLESSIREISSQLYPWAGLGQPDLEIVKSDLQRQLQEILLGRTVQLPNAKPRGTPDHNITSFLIDAAHFLGILPPSLPPDIADPNRDLPVPPREIAARMAIDILNEITLGEGNFPCSSFLAALVKVNCTIFPKLFPPKIVPPGIEVPNSKQMSQTLVKVASFLQADDLHNALTSTIKEIAQVAPMTLKGKILMGSATILAQTASTEIDWALEEIGYTPPNPDERVFIQAVVERFQREHSKLLETLPKQADVSQLSTKKAKFDLLLQVIACQVLAKQIPLADPDHDLFTELGAFALTFPWRNLPEPQQWLGTIRLLGLGGNNPLSKEGFWTVLELLGLKDQMGYRSFVVMVNALQNAFSIWQQRNPVAFDRLARRVSTLDLKSPQLFSRIPKDLFTNLDELGKELVKVLQIREVRLPDDTTVILRRSQLYWPEHWNELCRLSDDELVARIEALTALNVAPDEFPDTLLLNPEVVQQIAELLEKIKLQSVNLATQSEELSSLSAKVGEQQSRIESLETRLEGANKDLSRCHAHLGQIRSEKEMAEKAEEEAEAEVARLSSRSQLLVILLGVLVLLGAGSTLWAWRKGQQRT